MESSSVRYLCLSGVFALLVLVAFPIAAQPKESPTRYYRYPFSAGVEYQNLFLLGGSEDQLFIYDVTAELQMPLPGFPHLVPQLNIGMTGFDNRSITEPDKLDNTSITITGGTEFSYRFNRIFEVGVEAYGGYVLSLYPNYDPARGTLSNASLVFGGGPILTLSPFYNLAFHLRPSVRYYTTIGALDAYDGLYAGVGASVSLRLGKDPDAAGSIIRSIRFSEPKMEPLFAAMQSYYARNPVGSVTITNREKHPIYDVEVSFFQSGYMDSPTVAGNIPELAAGEQVTVDYPAVFNSNVFETEGITPLTGDIIAIYTSRGKPAEQRTSVTYDLHDKSALIWDDDRKIGAFITPADSSIRSFASAIRVAHKEALIPGMSKELQFAVQAYNALADLGMIYQPDPSTAFAEVQENKVVVDSVSLPRDTLHRITGDCDDLTALFCTILETVQIDTSFVTTPGHIYAGFNTKVPAREYKKIHPHRTMTMTVDGELWILVEITMIGRYDFLKAWTTGMQEFQTYESQPEKRGFYLTRKAQELYRPVGLKQLDRTFPMNREKALIREFQSVMTSITGLILQDYRTAAEESNKGSMYNQYGIVAAQLKQFDQAEAAFTKVLELSRGAVSARINLGSMYFLMQNYQRAADLFQTALVELEQSRDRNTSTIVKVLINLSRAQYELGDAARAQESYGKAVRLDPESTQKYSYLAQVSADNSRGEEHDGEDVFFLEEEDE